MPKYFSIKNNAPKWSRINRDYPFVSHVYISKSHVLHGLSPYASDVEDGNGIALCDVGDFYAIDVGRVYNDPSLTYSDAPTIIPETRYSHKSIKAQAEEDRFADNLFDLANLISSSLFKSVDRETSNYRNLRFPRVLTDEYTTRDCILEILTNKFKTIDELVSFVEQKELAS